MDPRFRFVSTILFLALAAGGAGTAFFGAKTAWAGPSRVSWHAVEAPGELLSLSDYLLQPPDGTPRGDVEKEDTTEVPSTVPDQPPPPPTGGQPAQPPPGFGTTDTTGRSDSSLTFPTTQFAPTETIGAQSMIPAASNSKSAPSKRGLLGLHPTALIAALIALHVVVVGLVAK